MYYRDACEKYWGEDLKQLVIDRGKNNKGRKLYNHMYNLII